MAIDIGRAAYEKHCDLFCSDWDYDHITPWERLNQFNQDKWRELAVAVLEASRVDGILDDV